MGKAKKMKPSQAGGKKPLHEDIESATAVRSKNRNKIRLRKDDDDEVKQNILGHHIL